MAKDKITDKITDKSYRLADDKTGEVFLLKVGRDMNLLVFDEDLKYNRAIRHCPNEKSIYVDEQSKHAIVEPIIFEKGYLEVDKTQQITQAFLDAHPSNINNKGTVFELVDYENEAVDYIEEEDLKHSIKSVIIDKSNEQDGIYQLEMVASVITGSLDKVSNLSKNELKRIIYTEIENDPYYFVNEAGDVVIFDDENVQRKYIVLRALKDNVIKKSNTNKDMLWYKDGKKIATAPVGVELTEFFADYLSTDEGMLVAEEIRKRS